MRYAVEQGHTVFMVSWRNVGPEQGALRWDDYLEMGVLEALRVAQEIAGATRQRARLLRRRHAARRRARGAGGERREPGGERRPSSPPCSTSRTPGQIGLFVDESEVAAREAAHRQGRHPAGRGPRVVVPRAARQRPRLALRGEQLPDGRHAGGFDLLYWNADSTNLPGPMYCWYLRNTYLENKLRVPGALRNCGVPVDLGKVDRPAFILATREDHIVPWRTAYRSLGAARRREDLRARRERAHRRHRQSGGEEASAATGFRRQPSAESGRLARAGEGKRGQLVAALDAVAGRHSRAATRDAPAQTGNAQYQAIEPAPGPLRESREG